MDSQVVIKGLLINYTVMPGDSGCTLLFLHGWRSEASVWQSIISNIQFPISNSYALDLPGFGKSQVPSRAMTVGDYAEVVAEFIKKLDLKNVIVIGHSFGGRVGIKLASHFPNLIEKLVLVDSAGFVTQGFKKSALRLLARAAKPLSRLAVTQGLRRKIYQFIGAEDYLATPALQETFVKVINEDLSDEMKKITCPALIVWGENDEATPMSFGERIHSLIHNSKFIILPHAGHFSFLDKPEEFARIVGDFIK